MQSTTNIRPAVETHSDARDDAKFAPISRRQMIAGGGAALAAPLLISAQANEPPISLGALGQRAGVHFGSAIGDAVLDMPAARDLYLRQCRILTSDPGFIMPFIRPEPERTTWGSTDRLVDFAAGHGVPLRAHCLIWNDALPDYMRRLSRSEVERLLDRHIEEAMGRYRGRIESWDVVNEPINPYEPGPGHWRKGPWLTHLGETYVARALKRAAATDPSARLFINETWVQASDRAGYTARRRLIELIDSLRQSGVALHGIGLQCHMDAAKRFEPDDFEAFLRELARHGVDIYITELDVDDLELDGDEASRDRHVAEAYGTLVSTVLRVPAVKAIITWQLADQFTWFRNPWFTKSFPARRLRFPSRALPFDDKLRPKLAHKAIAETFLARALGR
ncbi:MAG TPA: endo-1,4-beta-xylanase [Hyphomicrobiaceae bacterium]|nr:endo-1,4-beta-xylanase [Hyphomicrobiaceae bacterium]